MDRLNLHHARTADGETPAKVLFSYYLNSPKRGAFLILTVMETKNFDLEQWSKDLMVSEQTAALILAYDTVVEAFKHYDGVELEKTVGGGFFEEYGRARFGTVEAFDELKVRLLECIGISIAEQSRARGDFGGMV